MSHILSATLKQSAAPLFLKHGVLGALCAWANDDGTFQSPPTVYSFIAHTFPYRTRRYPDGRRLHERAIRYQLRLLERLGVLSAPPVGGRHRRVYPQLHPAAIARVTLAAVYAADFAKGASARTTTPRPTNPATATQPCNGDQLCNRDCNGDNRTLQPRPPIIKRSLKNRKSTPDSSPDLWTRTLEQSGISRHYRLAHLQPYIRRVTVRGPVLRLQVDDAGMRGLIERCYLSKLCAAADAVQRGTQIQCVSGESHGVDGSL